MNEITLYKCKHYEDFKKSCWNFSIKGKTCPLKEYEVITEKETACSKGIVYIDWVTKILKKEVLDEHFILLL